MGVKLMSFLLFGFNKIIGFQEAIIDNIHLREKQWVTKS